MAIFGQGLGGIGNILSVLLPFLFVLTIVVFIHELGHFLVARWCGVKIKAFSIGFGREIFGFYDRYGTRWRFAWIPLGGYVKFLDDENSASVPSKAALDKMTPAERAGAFQTPAAGGALGHRRRRAGGQFPAGDRHFRADLHVRGRAGDGAARRRAGRRRRGGERRLQGGRRDRQHRRAGDRDLRRHAAHRQRQRRPRADLRGQPRRRPAEAQGDAGPARDLRPLRQQAARRRDRHPPQPDAGGVGVQTLRAHRIAGAGREGDRLHHHAHAVLSRRCHYGTGVRRSDAGADRHRRDLGPGRQRRASCRCST